MTASKKNNKETPMAGAANPDGGGQKFSQKKAVYTIACMLVKSWQSAEFRISSRPEHSRCCRGNVAHQSWSSAQGPVRTGPTCKLW